MYFIVVAYLFELVAGAIVFLLGAAIGSFLNVVVYRLPAEMSLLHPPSRCPVCLHRLRKRENVPVLGWLLLRGRCAHCRTSISPRYPLVEAATGFLFLVVFWSFGFSWQAIGYWAFVSWLLALALIDLDTMTLPNPLTQSGLVLGLGFQAGLGWVQTGTLAGAIVQFMVGAIGAVVGIWLVDTIGFGGSLVFGQTAMGAGDSKLAAMMGAWLGWKLLLLAGFMACVFGVVVGVGAIAVGRREWRQTLVFGPFLALSALLTTLWGEAILAAYFRLFFPSL
ncbi:MAG TPA: prepilin peptidase [Thermosynechococcaceae cyanobacterium]